MSTPTATSTERRLDPRLEGVRLVAILLSVMWVGEIVDQVANAGLDEYGIEPRDADGLIGVLASPFLHADFAHLLANTVPFAVMGVLIALSGMARLVAVLLIVGAVGGLGTWLVAPDNTIHIGASGLVFGFGGYLLARAFFERSLVHIFTAAAVAVLYGGALVGGVLPEEGISWQGHLFGLLGGILAARVLAPEGGESADRAPRRSLPGRA